MTLMRAVLRRLWRLTRATSMVVGLAVMLALIAGVSSLAVAGTFSGGETAAVIFKGVSNAEITTTTLLNGGLGAALSLRVRPGSPPLTVNADAGTATNLSADKLDGKDSTDFAPAGTAAAYTARNDAGKSMNPEAGNVVIVSKDVPAGSYAINAKVSLHNIDDDDWTNASCQLRAGGSVVERGSLLTMGINGGQEADAVASTEEYPLQAVVAGFGGGAITINCNTFSNSDRVDATNAVVTAIKVGSVE